MNEAPSQEYEACFRLIAACCRFPGGTMRIEAVKVAAQAVNDWPLLLRLVRRHRVTALTQAALADSGVPLPGDMASALRQRTRAVTAVNIAAAAETARLQALLDAAGLASIVLKGVALAQLAYGSPALKFSQDIDLAILPENLDAAIDVLARDGYRPVRPLDDRQRALVASYGREIALRHPDHRMTVELRWRLVNCPSLMAGIGASSPHQVVALGEAMTVRTLRDDDLFAYLCVHGGGHGWSRLQWLADLNAFIAKRDDADLLRLYHYAQSVGAGICAQTALALCQRLFGRELPPGTARHIDTSVRARLAVAAAIGLLRAPQAGAAGGGRRFGTTRVALMQWLLGSGPRYYAELLRDLCFRLDDMLAWPLPRALHILYPLSRLPLWLWRKFAATPRPNQRTGSA